MSGKRKSNIVFVIPIYSTVIAFVAMKRSYGMHKPSVV